MASGLRQRAKTWIGRAGGSGASALLDFIYPPLCSACRTPVAQPHSLCANCWRAMNFMDGPDCSICGFPFEFDPGPGAICAPCQSRPPAFDRALAILRYDAASRDPILALKRADRLDMAPMFARWLARAGKPLIADADMIAPVPLHRSRLWERRFNQSALLSSGLSKITGIPCENQLLRRTRPTKSQGEMPSAKARRRNVRGVFEIKHGKQSTIANRTVLLVDDVFTTGSTVDACAKTLKRGGAAKVLVLTLARVVRPMSSSI